MFSDDNDLIGSNGGFYKDTVIKKTICSICDSTTLCGLDVHVKDGVAVKIEGTKENPHSGGTLCSKGSATRQFVYHPDRIKHPLKRVGTRGSDEFVSVSWEEALNEIADRMLKIKDVYGAESTIFYAGYPKWMRPFLHRLAHSFGSPNYCTESSVCYQAMDMSWKLIFGEQGIPDIKNTQCLFVWSANPFYSNTPQARGILDRIDNGMKLIVVDPRITPFTTHANVHLRLKPGTDGALALAIANVIIENNLYDQEFINNHTLGFEEFRKYAAHFSPDVSENITGVPKEIIREAAYLYAQTKPAALMPSAAPVVHNTNGVQNQRAALALIGLTGNYDVIGGNRTEPSSYLNRKAGFLTREHEYTMVRSWDEMPPRIGQNSHPVWCDLVDQGQSVQIPFQINSQKPYPVKAMIAFGLNYRMWPDSNFMLEALNKLDLLVVADLFLTDSSRYADYILPVCSSLERSEFRCYVQRYAILTEPAIKPLFESRPDSDVIFDLARRLNLNDPLIESDYEAALDWILEPSGLKVTELKKHPGGMTVPKPIKKEEKKYLKNGFATPSEKMEFKSGLLERYSKDFGYDSLPVYHPPKYSAEATPELAKEYPMILNTGTRLPMFIHSRTFRMPWTNSLRPQVAADINPNDAFNLGIKQGDAIYIKSPKNRIKVSANITKMVLPGVVHMYHGYAEADVNTLIEADYLDPISSYPGYKALLCRIEKI